jgi:flagellar biosynthesis/type III secretory pathway protein FliH
MECGILKEFLETHAPEVTGMNIHDWKIEDAIAVAQKEGREEGREEGLERGREEEREKWQTVVAEKDSEIAHLRANLDALGHE